MRRAGARLRARWGVVVRWTRRHRTLMESLYLAAGLLVGLLLTYAFAWAYPLGAQVVWACGAVAIMATAAMGVGPLMRARALDRAGIGRAVRR
jgi:hypothetical protein